MVNSAMAIFLTIFKCCVYELLQTKQHDLEFTWVTVHTILMRVLFNKTKGFIGVRGFLKKKSFGLHL